MSLENGEGRADNQVMSHSTPPNQLREAMGPGYQVAVLRDDAVLAELVQPATLRTSRSRSWPRRPWLRLLVITPIERLRNLRHAAGRHPMARPVRSANLQPRPLHPGNVNP
ncbi:MAG: hypothetical protein AAF467_12140 [Actinomycetota bacterium]